MTATIPRRILPTIIFSQFAGTSLWFAGNAIIDELQADWGLAGDATASVTSAVMFGFIIGTFGFALFSIADRFKPSRVFFFLCSDGSTFKCAYSLIASFLCTAIDLPVSHRYVFGRHLSCRNENRL